MRTKANSIKSDETIPVVTKRSGKDVMADGTNLRGKRALRMFGRDDCEELKSHLWEIHPELKEIEKGLPSRNLPWVRPIDLHMDCYEESADDRLPLTWTVDHLSLPVRVK